MPAYWSGTGNTDHGTGKNRCGVKISPWPQIVPLTGPFQSRFWGKPFEVGSEIPLSEERDCLIDHYRFHSAPESGNMKRLSGADGPVTPRDNRLEPVGG